MDSERARLVAKALGLIEFQSNGREVVGEDAGDGSRYVICPRGDLKHWLRTSEGQQRVRDRVDALWCRDLPSRYPRQVARYTNGRGRQVELQEWIDGTWQVPDGGYHETDAAALIWLAEREGE